MMKEFERTEFGLAFAEAHCIRSCDLIVEARDGSNGLLVLTDRSSEQYTLEAL